MGLVGAILTNATDDPRFKKELSKVALLINGFSRKINETNSKVKEFYSSISENCQQLLQLFKDDLNLISEENEEVTERNVRKSKKKKSNLEEWEERFEDEEEAVKGSALIEISRSLRRKDTNIFKQQEDFEWVWEKANGLFRLPLYLYIFYYFFTFQNKQ